MHTKIFIGDNNEAIYIEINQRKYYQIICEWSGTVISIIKNRLV